MDQFNHEFVDTLYLDKYYKNLNEFYKIRYDRPAEILKYSPLVASQYHTQIRKLIADFEREEFKNDSEQEGKMFDIKSIIQVCKQAGQIKNYMVPKK